MTHSSPPPEPEPEPEPEPAPAPESRIEQLVAEALAVLESEGPSGLSDLLARYPEQAPELRRHLARLEALGLGQDGEQPPTLTPAPVPDELGDFRLLGRIGSGGMGVVYRAEQRSMGRTVALKLVRSEHALFPAARERFQREIASVARLQHPAIVPVFATGEDAQVPWLAMELIDGASLEEVLQQLESIDPSSLRGTDLIGAIERAMQARGDGFGAGEQPTRPTSAAGFSGSWNSVCVRIALTIGEALDHAHRRGVLHRDVKPSNIMLTRDGRAMLLDFGLARTEAGNQITRTGNLVGTPAYMSPEQTRGEHSSTDARSDVYSLGVTLHELLTLRCPFASASTETTRRMILNGEVPWMRERNASVASDIELVCRKAMDLDPNRRYPSSAALAADLRNVLESRPVAASAPTAWLVARRWAQRRPAAATMLVAGLLLFCVVPTVFYLQQRAANRQIEAALDEARTERDNARRSLAGAVRDRLRAREAVDTMLTQVASQRLRDVPGLQDLRRELLMRARTFHEEFLADSGNDPDLLAESVDAARMLAVTNARLSDWSAANESGQRAVTLARRLVATNPNGSAERLKLALALATQGSARIPRGELAAARDALAEACAFYRLYCESHPDELKSAFELLLVQQKLALTLTQLNEIAATKQCFLAMSSQCADLQRREQGSERWPEVAEHITRARAEQAEFLLGQNDIEAANQVLADSPSLAAFDPSTLEDFTTLSLSRMDQHRARIAVARHDYATAERFLRQGLARIRLPIERNPDYVFGLRMEANLFNSLSMVHSRTGLQREAREAMGEAMRRLDRLLQLDREAVEDRANLAACYMNLGYGEQEDGNYEAARAFFEKAQPLLQEAIETIPTRSDWQVFRYNLTWFLGQVHGHLRTHQPQAAAARRLAALRPEHGRSQRIAAGLLSEAASWASTDEELTTAARSARVEALVSESMQLLRRAAELGCTDADRVRDGEDFDAVRARDGFLSVVQQLEANRRRRKNDSGR